MFTFLLELHRIYTQNVRRSKCVVSVVIVQFLLNLEQEILVELRIINFHANPLGFSLVATRGRKTWNLIGANVCSFSVPVLKERQIRRDLQRNEVSP
jgi:hypothetical protein